MRTRQFALLSIKTAMLVNTILYLFASLTPFFNFKSLKFGVLLSIGFPFLLLTTCITAFLSIFLFKKQWWFFVIIIALGATNIRSSFAFNWKTEKQILLSNPNHLKVLSWNVEEFIESIRTGDNALKKKRQTILQFIKETNADIICLQDFRDYPEDALYYSNKKYIVDSLKYQYYFISLDDTLAPNLPTNGYGTAIFSKYPIVNTGRIAYNSKHKPEHLNFADVAIGDKKIRVYNTHFKSINLSTSKKDSKKDYSFIQDDTAVIFSKGKLSRLIYFDSIHVKQAELVKQQLNKSPLPFVFCADLNSVPSSYVYHHISSGLQDAFLQKGFGWGPTYDGLSHTLRIDVTLLSPQLKIVQHYCPKLKASDHFPLVTDIALP